MEVEAAGTTHPLTQCSVSALSRYADRGGAGSGTQYEYRVPSTGRDRRAPTPLAPYYSAVCIVLFVSALHVANFALRLLG